jgi:Ohr subfamily peroxiredoxin
MKVLYTARASVTGGRQGHARTSDGKLEADLAAPVELGGSGEGTNPEQLFAAGYAACFQSAMAVVGRRMKLDSADSTVEARVDLGAIEGGYFKLAVELHVDLPGLEAPDARALVGKAHEVCPYSNATRGNIEVALFVGGERLATASAGG